MAISSEFGRAHRLLAAEHEQDLPDHGDQADGEQRLGDQVVDGDPAVTIAPYVIRAARSRAALMRQRCGRVVEVTAVTCESGSRTAKGRIGRSDCGPAPFRVR